MKWILFKDGNRILGDGKTWNGLIGGSLTSGLLCLLMTLPSNNWIFISPIEDATGWASNAFLSSSEFKYSQNWESFSSKKFLNN